MTWLARFVRRGRGPLPTAVALLERCDFCGHTGTARRYRVYSGTVQVCVRCQEHAERWSLPGVA